jgi:hypothetical protein
MATFTVKNNAPGARGVGSVLIEAGATSEVELTDEEAKLLGDFEGVEFIEGDEDDGSLSSMKVDDLKALAEEEGIDLGDATRKADIVSAIELAREEAGQQ